MCPNCPDGSAPKQPRSQSGTAAFPDASGLHASSILRTQTYATQLSWSTMMPKWTSLYPAMQVKQPKISLGKIKYYIVAPCNPYGTSRICTSEITCQALQGEGGMVFGRGFCCRFHTLLGLNCSVGHSSLSSFPVPPLVQGFFPTWIVTAFGSPLCSCYHRDPASTIACCILLCEMSHWNIFFLLSFLKSLIPLRSLTSPITENAVLCCIVYKLLIILGQEIEDKVTAKCVFVGNHSEWLNNMLQSPQLIKSMANLTYGNYCMWAAFTVSLRVKQEIFPTEKGNCRFLLETILPIRRE